MARILIEILLPLLAPLAIYLAWNAYARRHAETHGGEVPRVRVGPIFFCIIAGFALTMATLVVLALATGHTPVTNEEYVAPRLEDGKVLPPEYRLPPKGQ